MRDRGFLVGRLIASGRRGKVGRESEEVGLDRTSERGNDDEGIRRGEAFEEVGISRGY